MTGLVYLAIIALWVMFLIPWLGRHRDERSGRKSADRYHRAMDTLARVRENLHELDDDDEAVSDEAEHADHTGPTRSGAAPAPRRSVPGRTLSHAVAALRNRPSGSSSTMARRRRTVLAVLVLAVAGSVAAVFAGTLPVGAAVGAGAVLLLYLALVIRQAVGVRRRRSAHGGSGSAERGRYREATRRAQAQARMMMAPQQSQQGVGREWDAVPTTLPTYVSKPRASKVPRVVDLKEPSGGWDGRAMLRAAAHERDRARLAAQQFEREMSAIRPDHDAADAVAELANPVDRQAGQRPHFRRAANG